MKVEGSTETLRLLKHCTYFYTILTRVTFLFLNKYQRVSATHDYQAREHRSAKGSIGTLSKPRLQRQREPVAKQKVY